MSIKSYNYSYVPQPTPCANVTVRRTTVLSRNVCLGASTSGGVSDVLFEDVTLGDQLTPSMPWAIKFKISSGLIRNVTFRRIRMGPVGNTPWMYPNDRASAFMIDFFDRNATAPQTWVDGVTFEDISVVSAKTLGHFNGPGSCLEGLTVRNVTVGDRSGGWGGCANVDLASATVEGVSPPLTCRGCQTIDEE